MKRNIIILFFLMLSGLASAAPINPNRLFQDGLNAIKAGDYQSATAIVNTLNGGKAYRQAQDLEQAIKTAQINQQNARTPQPQDKNTDNSQNQSKPNKTIIVKTKDWGPEFDVIKNLFGQASQDREELRNLRQKYIDRYLSIRDEPNPDFAALAQNITQETIEYIKTRISETIRQLGKPPVDFCIVTMGSMARQESGLYTDLEIGILVKERNIRVVKYFQNFAQKLSDRFFLLGEHPSVGGKGLRMDEANNSPAHLHFFARYACPEQAKSLLQSAIEKREFDKIPYEGSRIFLATPQEFAEHINPNFLDQDMKIPKEIEDRIVEGEIKRALNDPENKNRDIFDITREVKIQVYNLLKPLNSREKQISASAESLIRNIKPLYGDESLFNEYLKKREVYLSGPPKNPNPFYSNHRQELAFSEMKKDILKFLSKPESAIVSGKLDKAIDIKRELYRFPEQILTNLGFWYDLGEQNSIKIAQLLAEKGLMNKKLSQDLARTMNYFIGLRFKKQEICRKQTPVLPTTLEEYEDQKKELEDELTKLEQQREFLIKANATSNEIEKINEKISKIKSDLIEFKKLKPLEEDSILSPSEINKIESIYLPILHNLFERAKSFLSGNKNAFIEDQLEQTTIEPSSQQAMAMKSTRNKNKYRYNKADANKHPLYCA